MRRLLFVLAHPDDESMATGTTVARHTRTGVAVHLLTVTRGGAGWTGRPAGRRPAELPAIRSEELRRATAALGVAGHEVWDYPDGGVAGCDQAELTGRIESVVRRLRPDVIVGWGPDGGYGHPDHIAVGACTDAAAGRTPLYHVAADRRRTEREVDAMRRAGADTDALPLIWQARVSVIFRPTAGELAAKAAAVRCHESQLTDWLRRLIDDPELLAQFGDECYLRPGEPGDTLVLEEGVFPELAPEGEQP